MAFMLLPIAAALTSSSIELAPDAPQMVMVSVIEMGEFCVPL